MRLDLPEPDRAARKTIFDVHLKHKALASDVDVEKLADVTDGFVGADIESICRRASMEAIRASVESTPMPAEGETPEPHQLKALSMANFEHAIEAVKALRATTEKPSDAPAEGGAPATTQA